MAAKKTEQDQDSTPGKAADAAQSDVSQTAAAAPAAAAPPQADPAAAGEQPSDQAAPAAPAAPSPSALAADAAAAPGDLTGTPELSGYLVTEVSSVLHDDTWYDQGDEIFLSDKEANPLLRRRIIELSWSKK
jgi:hypothetical protein